MTAATALTTIDNMIAAANNMISKIVTMEDEFRAAYTAVRQAGGRANLSDMRAQMSLSRSEFDTQILELEDARKLTLYDLDAPHDRTAKVMAGGVEVCPGLYRQICYMR